MTRPVVYLSGPISGLTQRGAADWRTDFIRRLTDICVKGVSPMRGCDGLDPAARISAHGRDFAHESPLLTGKGITDRDRFDATRCDVMLVNLLDAERVSIGTMIEIGWADAKRIPILLVAPETAHPHDHLMVNEIASWRVTSLDDAFDVLAVVLA